VRTIDAHASQQIGHWDEDSGEASPLLAAAHAIEAGAEWLLNSGDAVGLHCRQNASFHAEGDQLNNGDKVRIKRAAPQGRFELFPII